MIAMTDRSKEHIVTQQWIMKRINTATAEAFEDAIKDLRGKIMSEKALAKADDKWKWELREQCLRSVVAQIMPTQPNYIQKVADGTGDSIEGVLAKAAKRSVGN